MDVTPLISSDKKVIQNYSSSGFKISGKSYATSLIIFPDKVVEWSPPKLSDLQPESFDADALGDLQECDVILLGTGERMSFPPAEFRKQAKENGLHIESMDTGAACRTYNVLMAEGRRVAAALYKI